MLLSFVSTWCAALDWDFFEPDGPPTSANESGEQSAWCSEGERVRQQQGGWDDISEGFAGVTIICDACFERARQRNQK